jgi:hypothetical protein
VREDSAVALKPGTRDFCWIAGGAIVLLALAAVMLYFHRDPDPAARIAFKTQRLDRVGEMRLALATASEAELSAVMATTDEESQAYADQARAAVAQVEQGRVALADLLRRGGARGEQDSLAVFTAAFDDFRRIDRELLDLAVRNTNLKAYGLAFGAAADQIERMDAALSRIEAENAASAHAVEVMQLAGDARIAALRIATLLAPHIGEESGPKMDELEARMAREDRTVRANLARLASVPGAAAGGRLAIAEASYARFGEIRAQILQLSRENTNVRSLTLSLTERRTVLLKCQDALAALERAIRQETIPNAPALPR